MKKILKKLIFCSIIVGLFMTISSGFVSARTLTESFTTSSNLRLRSGPSLDAGIIKTVPEGTLVTVTDLRDGEWFAVEVEGRRGYMFAEHLFPSFRTSASLRLRTGPSLDARVIKTVSQNVPVQVIDFRDGEWFEVEVAGMRGYMFAQHLSAPFRTATNLRLRTSPSLDGGVIKTVPQGTVVQVNDFLDGEWFAVEVDGRRGYMYAEHLTGGAATGSSSSRGRPVIGPNGVELLEWSYVRTILRTGEDIQITDVRTGTTYTVRSFSNGNHADVETVTADDTAAMLSTYNGTWSWNTRPVWVHIGDRTIAASINGMPHGGGSIRGNNMNGHVCLHFYGSRTHNGSRSHERSHQNSVQEAFRAAS